MQQIFATNAAAALTRPTWRAAVKCVLAPELIVRILAAPHAPTQGTRVRLPLARRTIVPPAHGRATDVVPLALRVPLVQTFPLGTLANALGVPYVLLGITSEPLESVLTQLHVGYALGRVHRCARSIHLDTHPRQAGPANLASLRTTVLLATEVALLAVCTAPTRLDTGVGAAGHAPVLLLVHHMLLHVGGQFVETGDESPALVAVDALLQRIIRLHIDVHLLRSHLLLAALTGGIGHQPDEASEQKNPDVSHDRPFFLPPSFDTAEEEPESPHDRQTTDYDSKYHTMFPGLEAGTDQVGIAAQEQIEQKIFHQSLPGQIVIPNLLSSIDEQVGKANAW